MSSSSPSVLETFNYLWPNIWTKNTFLGKLYVISSLLLIFIAIAFNLSTPLFLKEAVLALSNERTFIQIAPLLLIVTYAVVWSASKIFVLISQAVAYPVEIDTARRFSLQLFNHIHELSTRYHKDRKLGELLSVIERTNSATVRLIGRPAIMLLPIFVEITVAIIVLSYFYDIRFGAVLFSMLALYSFLNYFTSDWVVESRKRQNEKDSASNSFIVDSLLHAETVKCFNTQPYEVNEAMRLLKEKEIEDTNMLQTDAKIHLAQSAIVGLCIIIMTYMSGEEVVRGNMNVGDFVFIHGYLLLFMLPLSTLGYNIRLLRNDMTQFKTAIDIL
ncbi:MAG: ABC transporter ATP-binding protein/permease, partial [Francisellaceae bacterium]|nr:ABC transporter ATP-binding protein/permease [Francisellaceae bacterium]